MAMASGNTVAPINILIYNLTSNALQQTIPGATAVINRVEYFGTGSDRKLLSTSADNFMRIYSPNTDGDYEISVNYQFPAGEEPYAIQDLGNDKIIVSAGQNLYLFSDGSLFPQKVETQDQIF